MHERLTFSSDYTSLPITPFWGDKPTDRWGTENGGGRSFSLKIAPVGVLRSDFALVPKPFRQAQDPEPAEGLAEGLCFDQPLPARARPHPRTQPPFGKCRLR